MGTVTEEQVDTAAGDKRRVRPNQLIIAFWAFFAVVTILSGIASAVFDFHHEDNAQTREVFGNIPTAIKVVFYTLVPALLIYVGFQLSFRVKNWQRALPRTARPPRRTSNNVSATCELVCTCRPSCVIPSLNHALHDLLRLPDLDGGHHDSGDRSPASRSTQVPRWLACTRVTRPLATPLV